MNLPSDFIQSTCAFLGEEEFAKLTNALTLESPVSVRLNPWKTDNFITQIQNSLQNPVPWGDGGFYLNERLTFTFDPLFHAGCYYVQEASSMFLSQALKQYVDSPVRVLDLCAAPGGKSTHLRSLIPDGSLLVANEVIRSRSQVLAENLSKWGHPDVVVTNSDPSDFSRLPSFFDIIVADVPCSGEGMFRKDKDSISEWSMDNVEICRQRQRRIIASTWAALKPGGVLIYSTCTYNTKENEENIDWILSELGAECMPLEILAEWNVTGNLAEKDFPVYRFFPHKTKGEGFFMAVLRKNQEDSGKEENAVGKKKNKNKNNKSVISPTESAMRQAKDWLQCPDEFTVSAKGNLLTAVGKEHADHIAFIEQTLRVIQSGITIGEVKGKDLIPHHHLAMSKALCKDAFIRSEVSYEQAISYLRKETIVLDESIPKGFILLTYKSVPLGWVKNIGNRANNLYPQEWRIRSGYLPDELRTLTDP